MDTKAALMFRVLRSALSVFAPVFALSGCPLSPDRIALPIDAHIAEIGVGMRTLPLSEGWSFVRVAPFWWDDDRLLLANVSGVTVFAPSPEVEP